jgi:hypothetical protein
MIGSWTIGAQLSTSHLSLAALDEQRMLDGVRDVLEAIELDLLIIGFREAPEVFRRFCAADRPVENVYLWFSALSDTAGMTEEDLIVDWRGARSRGWEAGQGRVVMSRRLSASPAPTIRLCAKERPCICASCFTVTISKGSVKVTEFVDVAARRDD